MGYVVVETRVVPASGAALWKFPHKSLKEYAKDLGVGTGKTKAETIGLLVQSGKATMCASLGN